MPSTTPMYEKLRNYIDSGNISRKLVAQNADISESQLSLMLNGKRRISVEDYEKLCRAMAVEPARFFTAPLVSTN